MHSFVYLFIYLFICLFIYLFIFSYLFRAVEERRIAKKNGTVLTDTLLEAAIKIGLRNTKSVKIPFYGENDEEEKFDNNNEENIEIQEKKAVNVDEKKSNSLNLFLRKSSSVLESLIYENKRRNTENDSEKNDKRNNNGGNIFNHRVIHLGLEEEKTGEEKNNGEVCLL